MRARPRADIARKQPLDVVQREANETVEPSEGRRCFSIADW